MTTTEKYFRALGWERVPSSMIYAGVPLYRPENQQQGPQGFYWVENFEETRKSNPAIYNPLPNITQSYPDFKKWVLEKMEGFKLSVDPQVWAMNWIAVHPWEKESTVGIGIKDNEILEAAVIAATTYWENKK